MQERCSTGSALVFLPCLSSLLHSVSAISIHISQNMQRGDKYLKQISIVIFIYIFFSFIIRLFAVLLGERWSMLCLKVSDCCFVVCSQSYLSDHVELITDAEGNVMFIKPRDIPYIPSLRLLHKYPFMMPHQQVFLRDSFNGTDFFLKWLSMCFFLYFPVKRSCTFQ